MNRSFLSFFAASLALSASGALAQSKLKQRLDHVDLGLQAVGEFTGDVSGTPAPFSTNAVQRVTISPSSTVGFLGTLRYTPKPYLGAEFNGGYARYTENLNVAPSAIQTQANEFTLGYLITPPYAIFGLRPYASAGVGGMRFAPTPGGGQGAPPIGRFAYYYNVGVQQDLVGHTLGVRAGFRQVFFTAPDFYQNYLTINKRTSTAEPMFGFYVRF